MIKGPWRWIREKSSSAMQWFSSSFRCLLLLLVVALFLAVVLPKSACLSFLH